MVVSPNLQNIVSTYTTTSNTIQNTNKSSQKPSIFDKLSTNIKNSRDVNDTVTVPRCIFKGYLCFMLGTSTGSIASLVKNTCKKVKYIPAALSAVSIGLSAYGTYNFVKPFLFKNSK